MNLYHIATREAWSAAEGHGAYKPSSLTSEGFVHCSTGRQVMLVAKRFYAGQAGLVLLVISAERLTSTLKWEHVPDDPASAQGKPGPAYPHVYGPINLDAVTEVLDFGPDPDGTFRAPAIVDREAGGNR